MKILVPLTKRKNYDSTMAHIVHYECISGLGINEKLGLWKLICSESVVSQISTRFVTSIKCYCNKCFLFLLHRGCNL